MKSKIKKLVFVFSIMILSSICTIPVYAARDYTYIPPGYHKTECGGCAYEDTTVVVTHNYYVNGSNRQEGTCTACTSCWYNDPKYPHPHPSNWPGTPWYAISYKYGYYCDKDNSYKEVGSYVAEKNPTSPVGFTCQYGHSVCCNIYNYTPAVTSFPGGSTQCTHGSKVLYCKGHAVANTYTITYTTTASGSSGYSSHSLTYDANQSLSPNLNNFSRKWSIKFVGQVGSASTTTSSTQTFTVTDTPKNITDPNGNVRSFNQSGIWNFTTTNGGTVTAIINWNNSFTSATAPSFSRTGYELLGYTMDVSKAGISPDGSTANVQLKVGERRVPASNGETWYAIWAPIQYTIAFDGNDYKFDNGTKATVTGSVASITTKFDAGYTLPNGGFSKKTTGYYGQEVLYTQVGWSQSKFASYINTSYNLKTTLTGLYYSSYANTTQKNANGIHFYLGETIKNYRYNGYALQYNLTSTKNDTVTLYANYVPENQRPYTYFRLATRQYNEDGTWNGKIENIVYDNYPSTITTYTANDVIVYDDMPIYLDTFYYDPEGHNSTNQYGVQYQYSFDGTNWYELTKDLNTPYFTTSMVVMSTSNLNNSKNHDNSNVINNSNGSNTIYGLNYTNNSTNTYMLEIKFKSTNGSNPVYIRSRAYDIVDYPTYLTGVTRNESTNTVSGTNTQLQVKMFSTGHYYTSANEYTGNANSWNGQKAFVVKTDLRDTTGGWCMKKISCYTGNSDSPDGEDAVIADLDNLANMTYPMWDYTTNKSYLLVSSNVEDNIKNIYGSIDTHNTLLYRGYVKTLGNGEKVDYTTKYETKTSLIRASLSAGLATENINRKYTTNISADESIGFINLSVDKDSYKHYSNVGHPTYDIDKSLGINSNYYINGDKSTVQLDNQFSLFFIAIYDQYGNEVITQGGGSTTKGYNANGTPINASAYTLSGINGHVYTSMQNLINDVYAKTNAVFSEHSDRINGEYTIYFGVCDKSWNPYSPNKWAAEVSKLVLSPRLSISDITVGNFTQSGYKNEDKNPNLWLRCNNVTPIYYNGYKFPMYRLTDLTQVATINSSYKYYLTKYSLPVKAQQYQNNSPMYVADNSLSYTKPNIMSLKAGTNVTISVTTQGADNLEIAIYKVGTNSPEVVLPFNEDNYTAIENKLYNNTRRENYITEYTFALPEQLEVGSKYYIVLKESKDTITNTTHPISSSNIGTKTLTRTIEIGKDDGLFEIIASDINDTGIQITN